jgi:hypothetical protein
VPDAAFRGDDVTSDHGQQLPPPGWGRQLVWATLRGLLAATVLVVLYYVLPFDRGLDAAMAARLSAGLLVFAVVLVLQVRSITGARYPALRAVEALGLILPLFLVLFASTYFLMERATAASFNQPLTRTDALYFTVTVFATVGFGDIVAVSNTARIVVMVQMLADLAILGAGIRVVLGAVRIGRERRSSTGDNSGGH